MNASPFVWFGEETSHLHIAFDNSTRMIVGAYGYSSFTHFRNRILLMSKLFTPSTKKGIKQPDVA